MTNRKRIIQAALFAVAIMLSATAYAQPHDGVQIGNPMDPQEQSIRHWSTSDHAGHSDSIRAPAGGWTHH